LSLPLVGLPLLFESKLSTDQGGVTMVFNSLNRRVLLGLEAIGAIFVGIYLAAYLGGIPTLVVYHSDPAFRIPLGIFGGLILVLTPIILVLALRSKKG
jgi:hypothetical protein